MKILFDRGVPDPLRNHLAPHEVALLRERGWSRLRNGELLQQAQAEFDILPTTDTNIEHQQNLRNFVLAVLVLRAFRLSLSKYLSVLPDILATNETLEAGQIAYVYADEGLRHRDEQKGKTLKH
jgi:predicted nuclease of predicted toxin-antitoxin system